MPDERWGEAPHAFVVLEAGATATETEPRKLSLQSPTRILYEEPRWCHPCCPKRKREMNTINIPGFNAETALCKTSTRYYSVGIFSQKADIIQPQVCDRNRLHECLNECGSPDPDGRDRQFVARCRAGCYRTFGQCPPPPPQPTNSGTGSCDVGSERCGPGCCPWDTTCCHDKGCCPEGTHCRNILGFLACYYF